MDLSSLKANLKTKLALRDYTETLRLIGKNEAAAMLAIDYYGGYLCIWNYHVETSHEALHQKIKPLLATIAELFPYQGLVYKRSAGDLGAKEIFSIGDIPKHFIVQEGELKCWVTLTDSPNTGWFPEQRDNRLYTLKHAQGARIANLFAYTGGFTLAAMKGNCEVVFSVDIASSHLNQIKKNLQLNACSDTEKSKLIEADVFTWLTKQKNKTKFDLILCDPPASGSGKNHFRLSPHVWGQLALACATLGHQNSQFLFCNNLQSADQKAYQKILEQVFKKVERIPLPLDYQSKIPIAFHYLCYFPL